MIAYLALELLSRRLVPGLGVGGALVATIAALVICACVLLMVYGDDDDDDDDESGGAAALAVDSRAAAQSREGLEHTLNARSAEVIPANLPGKIRGPVQRRRARVVDLV